MRKQFGRFLALGLIVVIFSTNSVQAKAASLVTGTEVNTEISVLAKTETAIDKNRNFRLVFDAQYYYDTYIDVREFVGMDAEKLFQHFMNNGMKEGRLGIADFSLRAYIENNPDLLAAFGTDYSAYCKHFVENGRAEGRSAIPVSTDNSENVIGSFSSEYVESEDRATNVELAAARINGMVIQPGEKFSFNHSVLPRTSLNGYVLGPAFSAGREVQSIGGGICQVSSTLYVAMIKAILPSTERYTHSAPVDYVPAGLDATIAGNSKDLKFVNIYAEPIIIFAVTDNGKLTVELKLDK